MDVKKYEVFVKIVEKSSLTKAAEAMGLTQSGVSHIVAAMESELGVALLRRSRTGAVLTPEGERLMPHIRAIVTQETQLRHAAEALRSQVAGKLRVGTFTSVATHWLPAMMMEFQRLHPSVEFTLFNGDYHDVVRWLEDGSVDLAFTAVPAPADCRCIPLYRDSLLAVLPRGHRLCRVPVCPAAELAKEPMIGLPDNSDHDIRRALAAVGSKPDICLRTKDDYAVIAMVRQGLGVSIMPSLLLHGNNDGVELRPLDPPASRTIELALPAGDIRPGAAAFADFAAAWVRDNEKKAFSP